MSRLSANKRGAHDNGASDDSDFMPSKAKKLSAEKLNFQKENIPNGSRPLMIDLTSDEQPPAAISSMPRNSPMFI